MGPASFATCRNCVEGERAGLGGQQGPMPSPALSHGGPHSLGFMCKIALMEYLVDFGSNRYYMIGLLDEMNRILPVTSSSNTLYIAAHTVTVVLTAGSKKLRSTDLQKAFLE